MVVEENFQCIGITSECSSAHIALVVSMDLLVVGCFVFFLYLPVAVITTIFAESTFMFEIIHVTLTIITHIFRFSSQDEIPDREYFPLGVAAAGSIVGIQWWFLGTCNNSKEHKKLPHTTYNVSIIPNTPVLNKYTI
ncbi:hypothetical protein GUJ93_ZPchr0001g33067 [Zizania palustris]|uniref:Uncharacterized protein n=1 Tax=Zizania palustris TaxID=103762 RepID=A0A8J5V8Z0_ZIZPA|nr:hypothetical protein GUJ93_ZPchr0001g33067 [Zizania palustris]